MKKKKESKKPPRQSSKKIQNLKEKRIREIKQVLSSRVKKLNLSDELLFLLSKYGVVSADLSSVEQNFYARMERLKISGLKAGAGKKIYSPLGYKKILQDAADFCLQAMSGNLHFVREGQENNEVVGSDAPWLRLPDDFFIIQEEIIRSADPKEIDLTSLSDKQRDWISRQGISNISDVFESMQYDYLFEHFEKVNVSFAWVNLWLRKHHPNLYELYLYGKNRYGEHGSFFPSMVKRLEDMDKFVNSRHADTTMIEIVIRQLRYLMVNDPLFAAVFFGFFYKQKRGTPPSHDKGALNTVKPYIYLLKFFKNRQIVHKSLLIRSTYDIGILLLNSLAGKQFYSTEKSGPFGKGLTGQGFKFKGSFRLYKELDDFRRFLRR